MIYISDLEQIISSWQKRLDTQVYPSAYRDALGECIYDLKNLVKDTIEEEVAADEAFWSRVEKIAHEAA